MFFVIIIAEKETYKKAREILDRFSNGVDINITPPVTPQNISTFPQSTPYLNATINAKNTLVQRNIKNQIQQEPNQNKTFNSNETMNLNKTKSENTVSMFGNAGDSSKFVQPQQMISPPTNQPAPPSSLSLASSARTMLPRPIIAPNRTFFDRLLEFIVGEGPNNRYMLKKNFH